MDVGEIYYPLCCNVRRGEGAARDRLQRFRYLDKNGISFQVNRQDLAVYNYALSLSKVVPVTIFKSITITF